MALRPKSVVFAPTDGVLTVLAPLDRKASGVDWSDPKAYGVVASCPFASSQLRYSDVMVYGATESAAIRKVRAQVPPSVDSSSRVAIGGSVYEVSKVDRSGRLSWLYLSELVKSGTASLYGDLPEYDSHGLPVQLHGGGFHTGGASAPYQLLKLGLSDGAPYLGMTIRVSAGDFFEASERAGGTVRCVATYETRQRFAVKDVVVDGAWATVSCEVGEANVDVYE